MHNSANIYKLFRKHGLASIPDLRDNTTVVDRTILQSLLQFAHDIPMGQVNDVRAATAQMVKTGRWLPMFEPSNVFLIYRRIGAHIADLFGKQYGDMQQLGDLLSRAGVPVEPPRLITPPHDARMPLKDVDAAIKEANVAVATSQVHWPGFDITHADLMLLQLALLAHPKLSVSAAVRALDGPPSLRAFADKHGFALELLRAHLNATPRNAASDKAAVRQVLELTPLVHMHVQNAATAANSHDWGATRGAWRALLDLPQLKALPAVRDALQPELFVDIWLCVPLPFPSPRQHRVFATSVVALLSSTNGVPSLATMRTALQNASAEPGEVWEWTANDLLGGLATLPLVARRAEELLGATGPASLLGRKDKVTAQRVAVARALFGAGLVVPGTRPDTVVLSLAPDDPTDTTAELDSDLWRLASVAVATAQPVQDAVRVCNVQLGPLLTEHMTVQLQRAHTVLHIVTLLVQRHSSASTAIIPEPDVLRRAFNTHMRNVRDAVDAAMTDDLSKVRALGALPATQTLARQALRDVYMANFDSMPAPPGAAPAAVAALRTAAAAIFTAATYTTIQPTMPLSGLLKADTYFAHPSADVFEQARPHAMRCLGMLLSSLDNDAAVLLFNGKVLTAASAKALAQFQQRFRMLLQTAAPLDRLSWGSAMKRRLQPFEVPVLSWTLALNTETHKPRSKAVCAQALQDVVPAAFMPLVLAYVVGEDGPSEVEAGTSIGQALYEFACRGTSVDTWPPMPLVDNAAVVRDATSRYFAALYATQASAVPAQASQAVDAAGTSSAALKSRQSRSRLLLRAQIAARRRGAAPGAAVQAALAPETLPPAPEGGPAQLQYTKVYQTLPGHTPATTIMTNLAEFHEHFRAYGGIALLMSNDQAAARLNVLRKVFNKLFVLATKDAAAAGAAAVKPTDVFVKGQLQLSRQQLVLLMFAMASRPSLTPTLALAAATHDRHTAWFTPTTLLDDIDTILQPVQAALASTATLSVAAILEHTAVDTKKTDDAVALCTASHTARRALFRHVLHSDEAVLFEADDMTPARAGYGKLQGTEDHVGFALRLAPVTGQTYTPRCSSRSGLGRCESATTTYTIATHTYQALQGGGAMATAADSWHCAGCRPLVGTSARGGESSDSFVAVSPEEDTLVLLVEPAVADRVVNELAAMLLQGCSVPQTRSEGLVAAFVAGAGADPMQRLGARAGAGDDAETAAAVEVEAEAETKHAEHAEQQLLQRAIDMDAAQVMAALDLARLCPQLARLLQLQVEADAAMALGMDGDAEETAKSMWLRNQIDNGWVAVDNDVALSRLMRGVVAVTEPVDADYMLPVTKRVRMAHARGQQRLLETALWLQGVVETDTSPRLHLPTHSSKKAAARQQLWARRNAQASRAGAGAGAAHFVVPASFRDLVHDIEARDSQARVLAQYQYEQEMLYQQRLAWLAEAARRQREQDTLDALGLAMEHTSIDDSSR